ncbi:MAG: iron uptake system protein EfeO [Sporichthyaceae bacterium]
MNLSRHALLAALLIALPLAACADDSDDVAGSSAPAAETSAPAGSASGAGASASGSGSASGSAALAGETARAAADLSPAESAAVTSYRAYLIAQVQDSITKSEAFVAAVKTGDVAKAKSLYAPSRVGWESIEPVAAAFGEIDPKVDLREADLEEGQTWTGWHVIEKALWEQESTEGMGAVGDQLLVDLGTLRTLIPTAEVDPSIMALGAKELMDEIAAGKITGEEEAFSHTDLVDFKANLDGARKVFELLRPIAEPADAALVTTIAAEFDDVEAELAKYVDGNGYVSYDTVTEAQRKVLADVVNALAEPLSKLGAAIATA